MDLQAALDLFELQAEANGRSQHTIRQLARHVALLASWAGQEELGTDLRGFDQKALARFLASPAAKLSARGGPRKASSANALRSSMRTFFAFLAAAGIVERDPSRLIRRARVGRSPPRGVTIDDRDRLLATLAVADGVEAQRDRVLFSLLAGAGLRLGSAVALDVEDLDLADGRIQVRTVKGGGSQTVFISPSLAKDLAGLVGDRRTGPIFVSRNGRRITGRQVQRRLSEWLATAGVAARYSPHALRHCFATELLRRTGDITLVQAALGHASIASTMIYARVDEARLRAVVGGRLALSRPEGSAQ